jgi:hypothetical protein
MLAAAGDASGNPALGVVLILIGIVLYWVPTLVAGTRHVRNLGSVIAINLLTGWTIVGWIVALAMALRTVDRVPAAPVPPAR